MAKLQEEQLSPESKRSAFGEDKLNKAYQVKDQIRFKYMVKQGTCHQNE